jgi:hypothetical protein
LVVPGFSSCWLIFPCYSWKVIVFHTS